MSTQEANVDVSSATKPSSLATNTNNEKDQSKSKEEPIEFIAISRSVHVFRPKKEKKAAAAIKAREAKEASPVLYPITTTTGNTPDAVVIMGWMDAPLRIVTKYAAPYAKLFPEATIIIKLSTGMSFMAGKEAREAALKGVIKILEEVQTSSKAKSQLANQVEELKTSGKKAGLTMDVDSQNRLQDQADNEENSKTPPSQVNQSSGILIHSFSDGGSNNTSQLLRLLKDRNVPPTSAVMFDCSPGKASPKSGSFAFTLPLAKRPYIRMAVRAILYFYLQFLYTLKRIVGRKTWSQVMRNHLNNISTWKYSKEDEQEKKKSSFPPRMYLYSKADSLIDWRAVEEHAREAAKLQGLSGPIQVDDLASGNGDKSKGIIAVRRWDNANHCDLGRADFNGYWAAIRSFLEAAL